MMKRKISVRPMGWALCACLVLMSCARAPTTPLSTPSATAPTVTATPQLALNNVPAARIERLSKAVNITRWFWFPEQVTPDYFENYMTDADLKLIHDMGVLSVRLVLSPTFFYQTETPATLNPNMIGFLDKAVDRILAHDLAVVIDMHDQDKAAWEGNPKYVDGFMVFWPTLAKHYAERNGPDIDRVYFEIVNEPNFQVAETRWAEIQTRWVTAMREVVPQHTLIVTGPNWGGIAGLTKLKPLADPNVVYSFHFYDPMQFTHQGATWAGPGLENLKEMPYPASPERCKLLLDATKDSSLHTTIRNYCYTYINASRLKTAIAEAANWAKTNQTHLWLGEFGVYCPAAPAQDRVQWIKDVRTAAESFKIGWSLWGYDECFGMQRKLTNGKVEVDTGVVKALGLTMPQ